MADCGSVCWQTTKSSSGILRRPARLGRRTALGATDIDRPATRSEGRTTAGFCLGGLAVVGSKVEESGLPAPSHHGSSSVSTRYAPPGVRYARYRFCICPVYGGYMVYRVFSMSRRNSHAQSRAWHQTRVGVIRSPICSRLTDSDSAPGGKSCSWSPGPPV